MNERESTPLDPREVRFLRLLTEAADRSAVWAAISRRIRGRSPAQMLQIHLLGQLRRWTAAAAVILVVLLLATNGAADGPGRTFAEPAGEDLGPLSRMVDATSDSAVLSDEGSVLLALISEEVQ